VHVHDVRHGFPQVSAHCTLVAKAMVSDFQQLGWLERRESAQETLAQDI
jgi:hypothetical protein